MAQDIDLQVIAAQLPPGSCLDPSIKTYVGMTRVLFPTDYSLFVIGPNEPTVEQRTYAWIKTDGITGVVQGLYTWSALYGLWLKPHWNANTVPTNERRIFVGSTTALETYDGGESATISETTGPFWSVDTDFEDKFPLGVGATIATVATDDDVFDDATPGGPQARSVWFIKPSGRVFDRAS